MEENLLQIHDAFYDLLVLMSDKMPEKDLKTLVDFFFNDAEKQYSTKELAEKFASVEAVLNNFLKFLRSQEW